MNPILFVKRIARSLDVARKCLQRWCFDAGRLAVNNKRGVICGVGLAGLVCFIFGYDGNSAAMNQSTANVTHITDAEFETNVLQSTQPVVVDCYATWCGPCKMLAPIVDNVADAYAGKIKFYKVNVDESPKVSQKFQIQAIPTLLFFNDGKLVSTSVGLVAKANLIGQLDALLATNVQAVVPGR